MENKLKEAVEILCKALKEDEYYYDEKHPLTHWSDIDYRCFGKSHAIYSGYGVVRVYNYLKSVGIDIFK